MLKYWKYLFFILLGLLNIIHSIAQEEDYGDHEKYPVYYKETEYTLEIIDQLPRDTIYLHDTLVISDIDDFLKQYNCDLKEFVKKYGSMKEMMDSLNNISGARLYFNYFLSKDSIRKLSNRFIIKEFTIVRPDSIVSYDMPLTAFEEEKDSSVAVRREILFRIKDPTRTDRFLNNPDLILKTISSIFTYMQSDTLGIKGINLYFPDFTFKEKRAMTQFVKSVRIAMDASKKFKFKDTRLNVTFHAKKGMENIDKDFQYCLMQEASEVLFLSETDLIENYYVKGQRITSDEMKNIGFFAQLISHLYIARYYTGDIKIEQLNLERFTTADLSFVLYADYSENLWEIYLYILIGIVILILALIILYSTWLPFSTLVNENMESILLIAIIIAFEIIALIITIFQHMCQEDSFIVIENNPYLIFTLPLILILVIPFMVGVFKKKRVP